MQGQLPSGKISSILKLEDNGFTEVDAIAGCYAHIPTIVPVLGKLKGFYVQINGANEYFKVDFNDPIYVSKSNDQTVNISTNSIYSRGQAPSDIGPYRSPIGVADEERGFADSTIIIKLPANIKTPNTICITYRAYDINNDVTEPVSLCIHIWQLAGGENTKKFEGVWRESRVEQTYANGQTTSYDYTYDKWMVAANPFGTHGSLKYYLRGDSTFLTWGTPSRPFASYFIKGDTTEHFINAFVPRPNEQPAGQDSEIYKFRNTSFKSDGSFTTDYYKVYKGLYWDNGPAYYVHDEHYLAGGYWGYNTTGQKLIMQTTTGNFGPELPMQHTANISDNIWIDEFYNTKTYLQKQ